MRVKKPQKSGAVKEREKFFHSPNLIVPNGVYVGDGTIFASENPIFQSRNRFLAVSAPGNP